MNEHTIEAAEDLFDGCAERLGKWGCWLQEERARKGSEKREKRCGVVLGNILGSGGNKAGSLISVSIHSMRWEMYWREAG